MSQAEDGARTRIAAAIVAGALAGVLAGVVVGVALVLWERTLGQPRAPELWRAWLLGGGWAWLPLWGVSVGLLAASRTLPRPRRIATVGVALALALLPLVWKPVVGESPERTPRGRNAKALALRRWAYRGPDGLRSILRLSHDPDPVVREQAVLALGENELVKDLEYPRLARERYEHSPLRAEMRARLVAALDDPVEAVRAEAARALWKAPRTFGSTPAAAETLAAVLDRGLRPGVPERLVWLALDAAAGASHARLDSAAARFARVAPDSDLARAARQAAGGR